MTLYAADCNKALRLIAHKVHSALLERRLIALDYSSDRLARRLTQRVLAHVQRPYMRLCLLRASAGHPNPIPQVGETIYLDGLRLNVGTAATRCSPWLWIRSVGIFAAYWLLFLVAAFRGAVAPRRRGTLLYGIGYEVLVAGGSDARFLDFCGRGPLGELRSAAHLYVQAVAPVRTSDPARVTYARYPLLALLRNGLGATDLFSFLAWHLRAAFAFAALAVRRPFACLLARDFAFDAAARVLDRREAIEALLLTGSNFSEQMLWMIHRPSRRFRTTMAFYSGNWGPLVYRSRPEAIPNPVLEYISVDRFYVWNEGQARQVRSWGLETSCIVCGPVVFQLPEEPPPREPGELRVAIFDVTPLKPAATVTLGFINPYYRTETMLRFVEDVLAAGRAVARRCGRQLSVVLKPKRRYDRVHDRTYIARLRALAAAAPELRFLPPDENLFATVASADVTVAIPYTSPAYIAAESGRPAIYHDPTGELLPTHDPSPFLHFTSTCAELEDALLRAVARSEGDRAVIRVP